MANDQEAPTRVVTESVKDTRVAAARTQGFDSDGPLSVGALFHDHFRIERLIGTGGMGHVYLAQNTAADEDDYVALKLIRPELLQDPRMVELLKREAKTLKLVRHDALVSYEGFGKDEIGRRYLVMEYVEGPSLAALLEQGVLPPSRVLQLRDRLGSGLAELHRHRVVHRDISPDNIILPGSRIDRAKLIDLGLCKIRDLADKSIIGQSFAGKLRYASPEQVGMSATQVDERSDIYSLGLVLAACARGRPLAMGEDLPGAAAARQRVPPLDDVPESLRPQLSAMLQPRPQDRPQSFDELLRRYPVEAGGRPLRALVITASFAAVGVLGLGAYALLRDVNAPEPPEPQTAVRPGVSVAPGEERVPARPPPPPITIASASPEPLVEFDRLFRHKDYRAALAALASLSVAERLALVRSLRATGDTLALEQAFFLVRNLSNKAEAEATFVLAEMYDPGHWSESTSPFAKPNPRKARELYEKAFRDGFGPAAARLDAMRQREE